jgi:hypothetical protein
MTKLYYIDDLVDKLTELNNLQDKIDKLEIKEEIIKEQIRNWLNLNHLDSYQAFDKKDQLWTITLSDRNNRKVDYDILSQLISEEEYNSVVTSSTTQVFKVAKAKRQSIKKISSNNNGRPNAPKASKKQ